MNLSAFNDYILFIVGMERFIYERLRVRVELESVHLNQMIRLLFESHMCDSRCIVVQSRRRRKKKQQIRRLMCRYRGWNRM